MVNILNCFIKSSICAEELKAVFWSMVSMSFKALALVDLALSNLILVIEWKRKAHFPAFSTPNGFINLNELVIYLNQLNKQKRRKYSASAAAATAVRSWFSINPPPPRLPQKQSLPPSALVLVLSQWLLGVQWFDFSVSAKIYCLIFYCNSM